MNKKIAKNYLYTIIYKILSILAPLITTPYVARILHSDGVGVYSYTYSIAAAFALVAALGINIYGQREIAYKQNDEELKIRTFDEIFQIRLLTTTVVMLVYFIFSLFYEKYRTPLLFQSAVVISTMFDISWYFQGIENFKIVVIRNLIIKFSTIVLIFIFVKTKEDVGKYILLNSLSMVISNAIFFFNLRIPLFKYLVTGNALRTHLLGAVTFFIPLIAVEIYSHLDKIMLGALVGSDFENGYYEQARKITQLVVTIVTSINVVMLPRISNLYALNDRGTIKEYYKKSLNVIYLIMLPCVAGLFIIADPFVIWFFGADFAKVSLLLKICCFMIPFMGIGNFVGMQFLSPTNQQNKMTRAYITAAIVNIVMNFILIPRFASVGALVASAVAEMISCGIQLYCLMKSEFSFNIVQGLWKYALAAIIMVVFLLLFNAVLPLTGVKHTLMNMMIGAVAYGGVLLALREDFMWIMIKKFKKHESSAIR